jgi:hypothetical protein
MGRAGEQVERRGPFSRQPSPAKAAGRGPGGGFAGNAHERACAAAAAAPPPPPPPRGGSSTTVSHRPDAHQGAHGSLVARPVSPAPVTGPIPRAPPPPAWSSPVTRTPPGPTQRPLPLPSTGRAGAANPVHLPHRRHSRRISFRLDWQKVPFHTGTTVHLEARAGPGTRGAFTLQRAATGTARPGGAHSIDSPFSGCAVTVRSP